MNHARSVTPHTRTQRRHLETVEEVKEIARDRLVQDGVNGLSLRAIARDMGVVPSALYRYFPSHGHLLDALADDAAASMLDHVEQAIADAPRDDHGARWMAGMRAYRAWALEHVPGYSLNFGDLSGGRSGSGSPDAIVRQLLEILSTVVLTAMEHGGLDEQDSSCRAVFDLVPSGRADDRALAATLSAWSVVHGAVALEVSGRLPDVGIATEDYFEAQLLGVTRTIGFQVDQ